MFGAASDLSNLSSADPLAIGALHGAGGHRRDRLCTTDDGGGSTRTSLAEDRGGLRALAALSLELMKIVPNSSGRG